MLPMTSTLWAYDQYLTGGLFRDAVFPPDIDKDLVIKTVLIECGEYEPLFKDAEFMRMATQAWSQKWYHAFERWDLALKENYDPLHNYDRHEEWTDKTDSKVINDATTKTNKSAYDSATLTPYDSSDYDNTDTVDATGKHTGHLYGNIGVTTSATMLSEEMDVRGKYNLYNMIADCYARELTLMVY